LINSNDTLRLIVLKKIRESIDEFCRVLILKMDPITFITFSYPFDIEVRLKQVYGREVIRNYENNTRIRITLDEMSFQTFTVNLIYRTQVF